MMQVADSDRYREAVARLKRLLYDPPGWESPPTPPQQDPHINNSFHHLSSHKTASSEDVVCVRSAVSGDGDGGGVEGASRWLMELLRHQEELIAQLEKENDFLKREVVTVGEGVRRMGKENHDLHRRLADALSQAITQGESSEISSSGSSVGPSGGGDPSASGRRVAALTREKTALQEQVKHLEDALTAMRHREQDALAKLKQALTLAEDTHTHTAQVRASSESALEELSALLTATKQERQELKRLLDEADNEVKRQQEQRDEQVAHQQQRIKKLQDEREEQEEVVGRLRQEAREGSRKVAALEDDLRAARAARNRLEAQLEEQRQHSKEAHSRLDQIIMTRSGEAAAGTARARELEERLTAARQDTSRLLQAITTLAQGSGRSAETMTTDDVKSERLAAEQQLSLALTALQSRHEEEVSSLREATRQQSEAMDALREEVARMRQQLAQDNENYRTTAAQQQEEETTRVREELQETQRELLHGQEQARLHGALYQQALEKLRRAEGKASKAEQQSSELAELVRAATRERNTIRREVTYLRKVAAASAAASTSALDLVIPAEDYESSPPPPPTSPPLAPPPSSNGIPVPGGDPDQGPKHSADPVRSLTTTPAALLATDEVFKNVTVAPGVTLQHLYRET